MSEHGGDGGSGDLAGVAMNAKRLQYFVLGVLLATAGVVAADQLFGGSGGGGAATSITSDTTTVTGGTNKAVCYVNASGKIVCDSTSPQWDPVTGTMTGSHLVSSTTDASYDPALSQFATPNWFVVDDNNGDLFTGDVASGGNYSETLFFKNTVGSKYTGFTLNSDFSGVNESITLSAITKSTNEDLESTDRTGFLGDITPSSAGLIIASSGPLRLASGGIAYSNERWYIDSANPGNFLAKTDGGPDIGASGANRPNNLFLKGVATLGTSAVAANNAAGNLLMASTDHPVKTFTATYDPGTLAAQTGRTDTITVTGIKLAGGAVSMSLGVDPAAGCVLGGVRASADDTVKVTWFNAITAVTACDTASSTASFTQQVN